MPITKSVGKNPLTGFRVEGAAIGRIGRELQRPECILAERDGTLWAADARGGVMRISADGTQHLIIQRGDACIDRAQDPPQNLLSGTLPNGLAFAANDPWSDAINSRLADGYIVLLDANGPRIVADGFRFANEIRLDAREEWLICADRLVAVTPEGDLLELMSDGDPAATARFEAAFATGSPVPLDTMLACGGQTCSLLTSLAFGGPDLSTIFLGGLRSTEIPFFKSPVSGLPMVHWF